MTRSICAWLAEIIATESHDNGEFDNAIALLKVNRIS